MNDINLLNLNFIDKIFTNGQYVMSQNTINPDIGRLFKRYRQSSINPLTGKKYTLAALSKELEKIALKLFNDKKEGLSPSAISRLENGDLIPKKEKLLILAEVLHIPESELKPLIDFNAPKIEAVYGGSKVLLKLKQYEAKINKTPRDWLNYLSYANILGEYQKSESIAEDALFEIETINSDSYKNILRCLINSKLKYAEYMQNPAYYKPLKLALKWAQQAYQLFQNLNQSTLGDVELELLKIEVKRCIITSTLEDFQHHYFQDLNFSDVSTQDLHSRYDEITSQLEDCKVDLQCLLGTKYQLHYQEVLEMYLYFEREKDRFGFKWLELQELLALWNDWHQRFTNIDNKKLSQIQDIPQLLFKHWSSHQHKLQKWVQNLFQSGEQGIVFTPLKDSHDKWSELSQNMLLTLRQHDLLEDPSPDKGFIEGALLFPLVQAKLGLFSEQMDYTFIRLLYVQTTLQTRLVLFYICSCSYMLLYKKTNSPVHLEQALNNWRKFSQRSNAFVDHYDESLFASFMSEAGLWSEFIPLYYNKDLQKCIDNHLIEWFISCMEKLFKIEEK